MFRWCEVWLQDLQEWIWMVREWRGTANYIPPRIQEIQQQGGGQVVQIVQGVVAQLQATPIVAALNAMGDDVIMEDVTENIQMQELGNGGTIGDLEQFQWP